MTRGTLSVETLTEFHVDTCCVCGVQFAMTVEFERARRKDHREFYCLNGHNILYRAESEESRLKRELEEARQATARWREALAESRAETQAAERRRAAAKGQLTKTLNRLQRGYCPNCNQKFDNVEEHMATEHPHGAATEAEE